MTSWTITPIPVIDDVESPAAWAAQGAAAVSHVIDQALWGHVDLAWTAKYLTARLREQRYARRVWLVAGRPGTEGDPAGVVGAAWVVMPLTSNEHLAHVDVFVHPGHRRQGVGTALAQAVEQIAAEHGRDVLIAATDHAGEPPADDPHALTPPTGSGRIRSVDPGAMFALHRGFRLEQAERYSVLPFPVAPALVARLHDDAAARAGDDYRLIAWSDRVPDEWVDQLAALYTRMSTDAPQADLRMDEDPWDAARVRTAEQSVADAGHGYATVAAVHVPSGTLAAFTSVEHPSDVPEALYQEDTLVLGAHRGRRLGMLVKTAMLRRLAATRPDARRVHTWNAEENDHMLAINVALGFAPMGVCG
ncbi:MAG: GNAT family N-acetyltransferase, partial [Cellulomonadaceae bacterium]|nr:GNAT family N-acetyltransferase [Cellulomonadaceae bacterium]